MSSQQQPDGFDDALALANGGAVTRPRPETAHSPSGGPTSHARPPHKPHTTRRPHGSAQDWATARTTARDAARPGASVVLPLHQAARHALADPLVALTDLPAFDSSAMDGWAVAGPGPWVLAESDGLLAGGATPARLADGQATPIATGARVPSGATAVLRSEYGAAQAAPDGAQQRLTAHRPPGHGTDIRPRGQECRTGDLLLPAGTYITPAVLGLAAAAGYDKLTVTRRPRVEVLVLGAELLHDGVPHGGLIRDALGPLLEPWLTELGADVTALRHLGDDADALREAVTGSRADLVLTTGGTAAGPVDHVRPLLARLGARLLVDSVAVRPGHPMLLARLPEDPSPCEDPGPSEDRGPSESPESPGSERPGARHLVGLPGNPLAAVSGLLTLVEPLLSGLADRAPDAEPPNARMAERVTGHPVDTRLVPVVWEGRGVRPLRFHGPAMLRGVASAHALAVVPPGGVGAGTTVTVLTLPRG